MTMEELFTQLLDLPPLEVVQAEVLPDRITLHCRSALGEAVCPSCLKKCNFVKDTHTRKLRDLPISGKRVAIHFISRQFVCRDCNRHFYEQYGFAAKNGTMTQRYEDFIYYRCQGSDLRLVSVQEDVCWTKVNAIFERQARRAVGGRDVFARATQIGMDEIALKKGHRDYVAVLVNLQSGEVMDILPDRSKAYLKSYFLGKGEAFCQQVECFCSDMWEGYLKCAEEVFPNATVIADRFHFFAYLNKEVDRCRRAMRRAFPTDEAVKHLKWALLKPREKLSEEELEGLLTVLEDPRYELLRRTWEARNEFRDILEKPLSKERAGNEIAEWEERHTAKPNRFVQRFADFFQRWKSYILNYFEFRHTTSPIEGINNKLKLIKRRAFGFLKFESFRLRAIVEFS